MFLNQKIIGNIRWNGGKISSETFCIYSLVVGIGCGDPVGPHKNGPLVHPLIPTFTSNAQ